MMELDVRSEARVSKRKVGKNNTKNKNEKLWVFPGRKRDIHK